MQPSSVERRFHLATSTLQKLYSSWGNLQSKSNFLLKNSSIKKINILSDDFITNAAFWSFKLIITTMLSLLSASGLAWGPRVSICTFASCTLENGMFMLLATAPLSYLKKINKSNFIYHFLDSLWILLEKLTACCCECRPRWLFRGCSPADPENRPRWFWSFFPFRALALTNLTSVQKSNVNFFYH